MSGKGLEKPPSTEAATAKAKEEEHRAYHRTTLIVTIASRMYGLEQSASDHLIRLRVSEFLDSTFENGGVIPSRDQWEGDSGKDCKVHDRFIKRMVESGFEGEEVECWVYCLVFVKGVKGEIADGL